MLGILLIYFIGKRFYDLSVDYSKNKWLYAILGVVTYYVIGNVFLALIVILDIYVFDWGFNWESTYGINLLALPLGLLGVWGFYILLEKNWKKSVVVIKDEIQDIGKNIEEN
ncbi:hypothetical protein [uncultured Algibacter sp.]|uniref:hypothetical protein n=1 Tax=uncultured Algibacter sp. TaxID=298659 RepID=UPI002616EED9|nr:hypothetical protein [uncultured Algibacter sp.]